MIAVKFENISKIYRFYKKPIFRLWEAVWGRPMHDAFPALTDISFTVLKGSTLGIIGDNGAGKSTLLKILARTLTPSGGRISIQGRVSALLELGSGFHHEFTGRQNIYLNASLLGLSEKEIKSSEQEIIEFADLGDFIDRPIRTYSSGMIVRLGFSIATSVNPDILVVDEALSVGDQSFQEKCIQRMQEFRRRNKTIIVCSHSMFLINALCASSIWLEDGKIMDHGPSNEVVSRYLASKENRHNHKIANKKTSRSQEVFVEDIQVLGNDEQPLSSLHQFRKISIQASIKCLRKDLRGHIAVIFEDANENSLFAACTHDEFNESLKFNQNHKLSLVLPVITLQKGSVFIRVIVTDEHGLRIVEQKRKGPFPIVSSHPEGGLIWMQHEWRI